MVGFVVVIVSMWLRLQPLEHLHSMVVRICHHDVALAVNGHARGMLELACCVPFAPDGADVGAIATQHLHSMVVRICHHDAALAVNGHAGGMLELACCVPFAPDCHWTWATLL